MRVNMPDSCGLLSMVTFMTKNARTIGIKTCQCLSFSTNILEDKSSKKVKGNQYKQKYRNPFPAASGGGKLITADRAHVTLFINLHRARRAFLLLHP